MSEQTHPPMLMAMDDEGVMLSYHPHYLSTACLHEQHETCRKVCKFCPEKCRCDCHKEQA